MTSSFRGQVWDKKDLALSWASLRRSWREKTISAETSGPAGFEKRLVSDRMRSELNRFSILGLGFSEVLGYAHGELSLVIGGASAFLNRHVLGREFFRGINVIIQLHVLNSGRTTAAMKNVIFVPLADTDKLALIDAEDLPIVQGYRWRLSSHGYAIAWAGPAGRTCVYMYRLVMGDPKCTVDHEKHNKLDNRKSKLRLATKKDQVGNQLKRPGTTSAYKGVCWDKARQLWKAYIGKGTPGRIRNIGRYASEKEAARAYNEAARLHFGDFAWLNKV